jgi:pimeloyl-ACP methyl ester carboxylesterase
MLHSAAMSASSAPHGSPHARPPTVDELSFKSLYEKTWYSVDTADGWSLVITRYKPRPQNFPQPLLGEPILLVHGFSQNRHAWTSGQFVKHLLYFGCDIHILELRGHGKSSVDFQKARAQKLQRALPPDLAYQWDIDSYFLYDLPAAVAGVKRITRRPRIFYCGHSMGGMIGYGYAGIHDDFDGLITIGSASDVGRGVAVLKLLSYLQPAIGASVDVTLGAFNAERAAAWGMELLASRAKRFFSGRAGEEPAQPRTLRYRYVPVDKGLQALERQLARAERSPLFRALTRRFNPLLNAEHVAAEDIRWLLREGGEREPRKVVEQFCKWIRRGELTCYRTGYDFKRGFSKISVPMAIIFGDRDPLASVESTRSVYRAAKSEYLLWRPVKGNSHIELTMGNDIRQICHDIKTLIDFARTRRTRGPALLRAGTGQTGG